MLGTLVKRFDFDEGRSFEVVLGDLLKQPVDAIVNAANAHLAHGGGVAGAISRAAGPQLDEESRRIVRERGPIPVGSAIATTAGKLPYKGVIHAVGPQQGEGNEEGKLVGALKSAFAIANEKGWTSVAFPAVSSGIFAVPLDVCARSYVRAAREFFAENPKTSLRTLRLVLLPGPMVEEISRAMEKIV